MLTIKHISVMGAETIYPAAQVNYWPNEKVLLPPLGRTGVVGSVTLSGEGGDRDFSEGGMVYVMNDHGSTVAKYDLGGWAETRVA